jgi:hypothetical protein
MSPSEFDLRAALHDGEGDGLDADRLILAAEASRSSRRARLLSAGAVAAVVAGVSVGVGLAWPNSQHPATSAATNQTQPQAHAAMGSSGTRSSSTGVTNGSIANSGGGAGAALNAPVTPGSAPVRPNPYGLVQAATGTGTHCPQSYPLVGTGPKSGTAALFSRPVATVEVCAYATSARVTSTRNSTGPGQLILHGAQASELVSSLENAMAHQVYYPCPSPQPSAARLLAFIAFAADGSPAGTVTTVLTKPACNVTVSSTTAARYQWQPPSDLSAQLYALKPGG